MSDFRDIDGNLLALIRQDELDELHKENQKLRQWVSDCQRLPTICKFATPKSEPNAFKNWSLSDPICKQHRDGEFAHCRQCRQDGWNAAVDASMALFPEKEYPYRSSIRKLKEKP